MKVPQTVFTGPSTPPPVPKVLVCPGAPKAPYNPPPGIINASIINVPLTANSKRVLNF